MSDHESKAVTDTPECAPETHVIGADQDRSRSKAHALIEEFTARIIAELGPAIQRGERMKLVSIFRRNLIPPRRPGRRPKETITAAYLDWKAGMRGVELYRKHIPGLAKYSRWRRKGESRTLLDAIHTRDRRERKRKRPPCGILAS